MAKSAKKNNPRSQGYKLESGMFIGLWAKRMRDEKKDKDPSGSWRKFVLEVFEASAYVNAERGFTFPGDPAHMSEDDRCDLLSERCYIKAKGIQKKVSKHKSIELPTGSDARKGMSGSKRATDWEVVASMFD